MVSVHYVRQICYGTDSTKFNLEDIFSEYKDVFKEIENRIIGSARQGLEKIRYYNETLTSFDFFRMKAFIRTFGFNVEAGCEDNRNYIEISWRKDITK